MTLTATMKWTASTCSSGSAAGRQIRSALLISPIGWRILERQRVRRARLYRLCLSRQRAFQYSLLLRHLVVDVCADENARSSIARLRDILEPELRRMAHVQIGREGNARAGGSRQTGNCSIPGDNSSLFFGYSPFGSDGEIDAQKHK